MVEIAIIGSDMQEVIGTAIAIYLLSSKAYVMSIFYLFVQRSYFRSFISVYLYGPGL